jgi:hypothetical protein
MNTQFVEDSDHYDIFVSYASEDYDQIKKLVRSFEDQGWRVFWDNIIPPGLTWRKYIGQALYNSKLMIVVWSINSINSEWVLEEAEHGKRLTILIPVRIDDVDPPFGFSGIQVAPLMRSSDKSYARNLESLVKIIFNRLSIKKGNFEISGLALIQSHSSKSINYQDFGKYIKTICIFILFTLLTIFLYNKRDKLDERQIFEQTTSSLPTSIKKPNPPLTDAVVTDNVHLQNEKNNNSHNPYKTLNKNFINNSHFKQLKGKTTVKKPSVEINKKNIGWLITPNETIKNE